jgi:multidrug efflux pump subunit AcrA (membrane-fusion protein)
VWARFKNPENLLIPYGVVTLILTRNDGKKYPAVTPSAVSHDVNGSFVYAVDSKNNMPVKRYVTLGNLSGEQQVIRKGLKAGELVITEGFHKIIPGVPVKPVKRGVK